MRLFTTVALASVLTLVLIFAACGGDDDDDAGSDDPDATATEDTGSDDSGGDGATVVEIDAADFSFSPTSVNTEAGVELTFAVANTGDATHTFKLYKDADYRPSAVEGADTGNIESQTIGEFKVTLDSGKYFFRCELHPGQMQGTITAE